MTRLRVPHYDEEGKTLLGFYIINDLGDTKILYMEYRGDASLGYVATEKSRLEVLSKRLQGRGYVKLAVLKTTVRGQLADVYNKPNGTVSYRIIHCKDGCWEYEHYKQKGVASG